MGDPKIYPVGDSHSWHCWTNIPETAPYTCGPMTLYHFGLHKPIMMAKIPKEAIVCFCHGEVDCRCHVFKFPPYEECIDSLVAGFREAVKLNIVGRDPKKTWIYFVPPPARVSPPDNPGFPFLGTSEQRLGWVRYMNAQNKKMCQEEGWTFVDIYDRYADADGYMRTDQVGSIDHIHVADTKPLQEFIDAHS